MPAAPSPRSIVPLEKIADHDAIVAEVTFLPNQSIPPHRHPGGEIVFIREGSLTLHLAGEKARPMTAGDTFYIAPRRSHRVLAGAKGAELLITRIHPRGEPIFEKADPEANYPDWVDPTP